MGGRALIALVLVALAALVIPAAASAERKDQYVISGSIDVPKGETAGDLVIVDGPVRIDGHVTGDVFAVAGKVTIKGRVDGDVTTIAERLRLREGGRVRGDVSYADKKPVVAPGASIGGKVKKIKNKVGLGAFAWAVGLLFWLGVTGSALILGILLVGFTPRAVESAAEVADRSTGATIGMGAAIFFGIPILAVLVGATVIGIPLAALLVLAALPLYALGYVASAWILGRRILTGRRDRFVPFLVGLLILRLIALIPVLGALVGICATAFGLGALGLAEQRPQDHAIGVRRAEVEAIVEPLA
ncbi:MAG TPA: polymer-forming cytoskeletal protein, partial [Thermoleophilaceae bacterium]|nr:polymer-forming cytoskeletal protein [Thermoleophilaceae bacterium]